MQVIATAEGYDGLVIRQAGDEFTVTDEQFDADSKWYRAKNAKKGKTVAADPVVDPETPADPA